MRTLCMFPFSFVIRNSHCGAPEWLSGLSARLLISTQFVISWLVSWSLVSVSERTVQSLLGILSLPPSLSLPPLTCATSLSISLSR